MATTRLIRPSPILPDLEVILITGHVMALSLFDSPSPPVDSKKIDSMRRGGGGGWQ